MVRNKYFPYCFLALGVIMQIVVFTLSHDTVLSFISGLAGCISVVLCSCKKISQYLFGFVQLFTYIVLSLKERFYGEMIENVFYVITMMVGVLIWIRNYNIEKKEVEVKELPKKVLNYLIAGTVLVSYLLGLALAYTDYTQPMLDSFTTVPAFVAQILLILRYREQWLFWLIIDVGCIILWHNAENYCMVAQYIFWTINCIIGWIYWSKEETIKNQ